jgi:hypothetical protein
VSRAAREPASFLIAVATGDDEGVEIPATDDAELGRLLGRITRVCGAARLPTPPISVSRRDRDAPLPLGGPESAERGTGRRPYLPD